jgi:hypothetical protein
MESRIRIQSEARRDDEGRYLEQSIDAVNRTGCDAFSAAAYGQQSCITRSHQPPQRQIQSGDHSRKTAISEVDANLVANHSDSGLFPYLIESTMKEFQVAPGNAYTIVTNRVRQINAQSRIAELDTLSRLEDLLRSTTPLSGRKILFFISDGFVVDTARSNGPDVMRRVIKEAARVGVVVYSLGTRANSLGPGTDVSQNGYPDFSPRMQPDRSPRARCRRSRWKLSRTRPAGVHTLIPIRSTMALRKP